jgi:hypothetical protein
MRCYCSICRKTAGGGGYAINIMGEAATLSVRGQKDVTGLPRAASSRRAPARRTLSDARRHFCAKCGSALWVSDPRWSEWVYPFAIGDRHAAAEAARGNRTDGSTMRRPGCTCRRGPAHTHFAEYPEESIADWHKRRGLEIA